MLKLKTAPKKIKNQSNNMKKTLQKQSAQVIETHYLDAKGKILGRLATEAANLLRGKNKTTFNYREVCGGKVVIYNAANIGLTGRKLDNKIYYKHTGYLGHLRQKSLGDFMNKKPVWVIRTAIAGMLPKNKLRKLWQNNLQIFPQNLPESENITKDKEQQ